MPSHVLVVLCLSAATHAEEFGEVEPEQANADAGEIRAPAPPAPDSTVLPAFSYTAPPQTSDGQQWGVDLANTMEDLATAQAGSMGSDSHQDPLAPLTSEQLKNLHNALDLNKDGKMTLNEVVEFARQKHFNSTRRDAAHILEVIDSDSDGKLSLSELLSGLQPNSGDEFDDAFADGPMFDDNATSYHERVELETKKFKAADKDNDGLLDLHEVPAVFFPEMNAATLELEVRDQMFRSDQDGDGKINIKEFEEYRGVSGDHEQDFEKLDKNNDGNLDVEELKNWSSGMFSWHKMFGSLFSTADKDKDGQITMDELTAGSDRIHELTARYHLKKWAIDGLPSHQEF